MGSMADKILQKEKPANLEIGNKITQDESKIERRLKN